MRALPSRDYSSFMGKVVGAPSPESNAMAIGFGGPWTGQEFHSLPEVRIQISYSYPFKQVKHYLGADYP